MTNLRQQPAHNPCRAVWHNVLGDGSNPLSTTQSRATGDFLKVNERPRIGGDLCDGSRDVGRRGLRYLQRLIDPASHRGRSRLLRQDEGQRG